MRRGVVWLLVGVAAVLVAQNAFARPGFSYKVKSGVVKGEETPKIILEATGDVQEATVTLERGDGKTIQKNIGSLSTGEKVRIPIDQPEGTHSYDVSIEGKGPEGGTIDTSFQTRIKVFGELKIKVEKNRAKVANGKLTLQGSRPIERVKIAVQNDAGKVAHRETIQVGGKSGKFTIEWPKVEDVAAVKLRAYDVHGYWRGVKIEPFWVKIPHKEVRFKFGTAKWNDEQVPKLKESLKRIREAMDKHGDKGLKMQLYVAGYTDTVGSKASNRKLSRKRARAIGRWFRNQGLDVPIFYQGFGEDVLAVDTPDDTKKKANRRAVYILGNARPPTSDQIPRSNWKRLN